MNTLYSTLGGLGLAVLLLIGAFSWKAAGLPEADSAASSIAARAASESSSAELPTRTPTSAPSRANVAPDVHARLQTLKQKVAEAPADTASRIQLARLLQDSHQPRKAARHYRRYLDRHPRNRQAWLDLAQTYAVLERWKDALSTSKEMLTHFPDDPSGLYNVGAVLANMGRYDEARVRWERVQKQDRDPQARKLAAQSLKRLRKMNLATRRRGEGATR